MKVNFASRRFRSIVSVTASLVAVVHFTSAPKPAISAESASPVASATPSASSPSSLAVMSFDLDFFRSVLSTSSSTLPSTTEPPETTSTAPPPEPPENLAVDAALSQIGVPYRSVSASPKGSDHPGFDCSGLVSWAWKMAGVTIPRVTFDEARLPHVSLSDLRAGDLLFFSGLGHVGIYDGEGGVIHAPNTGSFVERVPFNPSSWTTAVRPPVQ
jgi:cell wall-associated NlpC family hydrolase